MYSTTDFKRGLKIEMDKTPFEIMEFEHYKPGKGGAIVRTRLCNMSNGKIIDHTFRSGEKVAKADMEMREMQFLYRESTDCVLMDLTSYEQLHLSAEITGGKELYLKDGQKVFVLLYNGSPMDLEIPQAIVLEVTDTEPGLKGDTVSNVTKAATLESGAVVQVPIFINIGDKIKVDTRTNEYLGRE
jgi:elongation factor P